jgi:hypothetical protein
LPPRKALKQTNITGTTAIGIIVIGTIIIITATTTADIGPIGTASRFTFPFKPQRGGLDLSSLTSGGDD